MPKPTLAARTLPTDMQAALAAFSGPVQRIQPGQRALKPGQLKRADAYGVKARGHAV